MTLSFKSSCESIVDTLTSQRLQNWNGLSAISQQGLVPQSLSLLKYIPGSPAFLIFYKLTQFLHYSCWFNNSFSRFNSAHIFLCIVLLEQSNRPAILPIVIFLPMACLLIQTQMGI